jgi:ectoine hydroxylase-related dioxygenase (phytanoyl-CoA dioxygenase family)
MSYDWAFLPMQSSNDLLGDPDALRARLADESYLYFEQLIPKEVVASLRHRMLHTLADLGWIRGGDSLMKGQAIIDPVREGDDEFFRALGEIQRIEEFHELAHEEHLATMMQQVLGESAFPHPLKIARIIFPEFEVISTPPHQDFANNQGTENLTAAWVPVGDVPVEIGGLAVLRGSHKWGRLPLAGHLGAGNRCAVVPLEMLEQCRWVTTEFEMGDVLVFPSLAVHAARHNLSRGAMRISVDFRFQLEGEALTAGCLEPHFGRQTWDEIYRDWSPDAHRYYWHDLDYEVVPFEDFELVHTASDLEMIGDYLRQEQRSALRLRHRESSRS